MEQINKHTPLPWEKQGEYHLFIPIQISEDEWEQSEVAVFDNEDSRDFAYTACKNFYKMRDMIDELMKAHRFRDPYKICGHDKQTGHPLGRIGVAVQEAERLLKEIE